MARAGSEMNAMSTRMAGTANQDDKELEQKKYDAAAVAKKFKELNDDVAKRRADEKAREDELAKVTVSREDVVLVSEQLGITFAEATRLLRQNGGDAVKAFKSVVG
jgi:NACalpha-BTF3-like transcription factor